MDELEGELDVIKKELDSVISDSKLEERVSDPQDSGAMFADVIETNKKKIDQHELFEGDIMLAGKNTVYTALMSKAAAANIQHGDVITDTSRKWDMPIRYAYHSSLGSDPPSEFGSDGAKAKYGWELAIADLAKQTNGCFSFEKVSVNDPRKHLRIVSEGGKSFYILKHPNQFYYTEAFKPINVKKMICCSFCLQFSFINFLFWVCGQYAFTINEIVLDSKLFKC